MLCTATKTTGSIDAAVVAMLKDADGNPEFKNPFKKSENAIRDGTTFAGATACTDGATATIGLTVDNSKSTVGMTIRVRIRINKAKAYDRTTYIGPGESKTLTLLSGIPSATYKLRFIIEDDKSGQKTRGGVKKV